MGELDEHVFERSAALSQFAYAPAARRGEPKNFFSDIYALFHAQLKNFPVSSAIRSDIAHSRNLF